MVAQAAEWAAILDDQPVPQARLDACEAWCREHPLHRLALDRMCGLDVRFAGLSDLDRRVLHSMAARPSRVPRTLRQGLLAVLCLVTGAGAWLGSELPQFRQLFPDERTATGEVRALTLADGSGLVIDTATALDLADDGREVELFEGRILAEVAPDPDRPFVVRTGDGSVTALGTAFTVHRDHDRTLVAVIESQVRACAIGQSQTGACLELGPGERARIADGRVIRLDPVDPSAAAAWAGGWLVPDDQPLTEVLEELNRYRRRPVRYDARSLAHIRVTGSFPLRETDRALDAIAAALDLRLVPLGDGALTVLPPP